MKDFPKKRKCLRMKKAAIILCLMIILTQITGCRFVRDKYEEYKVSRMVSKMTLDEKVSQMIIPAIRTWEGENVTELSAYPELAEALRRHQYGGVILFGANITGTEQTARLVYDLQLNNYGIENVSEHIPYFMPLDEEGGIVTRLVSGTRMTGSMAIAATGGKVEENAQITGRIIGEELAALGFNIDFAPSVDVNNAPTNPVIGTRSFSDDPETVGRLGAAYAEGLKEYNIIPTFKHFPGHGDTSVDSHVGLPSVEKTYDELMQTELAPFQKAIDSGADMIMTAHITYPLIDDEQIYGDGITTGSYPATMSKKIITDILRGDMGFDGVVVTDALEMDAIRTAGFVPGAEDSAEYRINIAEKVINAGVDILLIPLDLNNAEAAEFYDEYISGIAALVENGTIPESRINESVARIIRLKAKYGILDGKYPDEDFDAKIAEALSVVGSDAHHEAEMEIAREAITTVKNSGGLLPVSKDIKSAVFLGRQKSDLKTVQYAVEKLRDEGLLGKEVKVTVDYYYDSAAEDDNKIHLTEETKNAVSGSDVVIALSYASGNSLLDNASPQYRALSETIGLAHASGGKFILISVNLPYDSARYTDADAIVLTYMGAGLGVDPTERADKSNDRAAYNANVIAAYEAVFGGFEPSGTLPVNIPVIEEAPDGNVLYGSEYLYERGYSVK